MCPRLPAFGAVRLLDCVLLAEALEAERERCPLFGAERERVRERQAADSFVPLLERVRDDFGEAERESGLDLELLELRLRANVDFDGAIYLDWKLNKKTSSNFFRFDTVSSFHRHRPIVRFLV